MVKKMVPCSIAPHGYSIIVFKASVESAKKGWQEKVGSPAIYEEGNMVFLVYGDKKTARDRYLKKVQNLFGYAVSLDCEVDDE